MLGWEHRMCWAAARVIAVSPQATAVMRELFGIAAFSVASHRRRPGLLSASVRRAAHRGLGVRGFDGLAAQF